jgi:hypothetical protein
MAEALLKLDRQNRALTQQQPPQQTASNASQH